MCSQFGKVVSVNLSPLRFWAQREILHSQLSAISSTSFCFWLFFLLSTSFKRKKRDIGLFLIYLLDFQGKPFPFAALRCFERWTNRRFSFLLTHKEIPFYYIIIDCVLTKCKLSKCHTILIYYMRIELSSIE